MDALQPRLSRYGRVRLSSLRADPLLADVDDAEFSAAVGVLLARQTGAVLDRAVIRKVGDGWL